MWLKAHTSRDLQLRGKKQALPTVDNKMHNRLINRRGGAQSVDDKVS